MGIPRSRHPLCDPPEAFHRLYRDQPLEYRPTVDSEARFTGYGATNGGVQDIPLKDWTERYFGEISHLDAAIGRLLSRVEEMGLLENTIIVFASDHGDMGGSRGLFEKQVPYEEAIQIPLFVRMPGHNPGRRTDALFSSVDFMPTLLGLCGLPAADTAEGVNYSPLIRGQSHAAQRDWLVVQHKDWSCIRRDQIKLTLTPDGREAISLYQLASDPYEQENLVSRPKEADTIKTFRRTYRQWLEDVGSRARKKQEGS